MGYYHGYKKKGTPASVKSAVKMIMRMMNAVYGKPVDPSYG